MKIIIAGATGFCGSEIVKQSLRNQKITSVVTLSRKPVDASDGSDTAKLKSVTIEDYGTYSEEAKSHFVDAEACIWTVAITPTKSTTYKWDEVMRVNHDCTLAGLQALVEGRGNTSKTFRFLYMSGIGAERDQNKTPKWAPEYSHMRGKTETGVLAFAAEHNFEACAAKPGLITGPGRTLQGVLTGAAGTVVDLPCVNVTEVAVAMIDQVLNGFEKEPLWNDDLVRIGQAILNQTPASKA